MKEGALEKTRIESDLVGSREVPGNVVHGVQTLRGIKNPRVSKFRLDEYPLFINALAITKMRATIANYELGLLTEKQVDAILKTYKGILEGKHHGQFPVGMIQGGTGTTTNMNTNEVITNRALKLLRRKCSEYQYCPPNDRISRSRSTNNAYPTAIHIGMYYTHLKLVRHFEELIDTFRHKAKEFKHVTKMGRARLEDAVPMALGQTFNGFASVLHDGIKNLNFAAEKFLTINMGATVIGTGITAEPEYTEKCVKALKELTGWDIKLPDDLAGATSDTSCLVGYSPAMRRTAVKMNKICNDLRLFAPGSRYGLGEINLPAMQPGSSIMPGKVDSVIPKVMSQINYKIIGNDLCMAMSDKAAQVGLNAMEPVMVQYCFESADLLMNGFDTPRTLCIDGITVNEDVYRRYVHDNVGVVTALNPMIGYKNSTRMAKEAFETGKDVHELVLGHNILSREDLDTILKPESTIKPIKLDIKPNLSLKREARSGM